MRNFLLALIVAALVSGSSSASAQSPPDSPGPATQGAQPGEFSDQILNEILHELRKGMEGHNSRAVISVFDSAKMESYLQFKSQVEQLFTKYEGFRLRYRIVQTGVEGEKGIAVVELQMEAEPRDNGSQLRRDQQIRLKLAPAKNGWKIVDFVPRDFFLP